MHSSHPPNRKKFDQSNYSNAGRTGPAHDLSLQNNSFVSPNKTIQLEHKLRRKEDTICVLFCKARNNNAPPVCDNDVQTDEDCRRRFNPVNVRASTLLRPAISSRTASIYSLSIPSLPSFTQYAYIVYSLSTQPTACSPNLVNLEFVPLPPLTGWRKRFRRAPGTGPVNAKIP